MRPRMLCDPLGSSDWEQHIVQAKAGSVLIGSLGIIQGRSDWLWGGMTSTWHLFWEVQQQQWRVKETRKKESLKWHRLRTSLWCGTILDLPLTTMQTEKEMSTNRLLCASIALQASDMQQVTQLTCSPTYAAITRLFQLEEHGARRRQPRQLMLTGRNRQLLRLNVECDPFCWWKEHQVTFPHISKVAQRYLCVPGTSVASERVFSTAGDIVSASRSRLDPEHVDMLIFLQKNLIIKT